MGCFICRRIWEDMPLLYDQAKLPSSKNQTLLSAHIRVLKKVHGFYRLDFTLSDDSKNKCIGTLLLQRANSNEAEAHVYTPRAHKLNSPEVLNLARSWIRKCIGPDHEFCPNLDFSNKIDLHSNEFDRTGQEEDKMFTGPTPFIEAMEAIKSIDTNVPFYPTRLIELGSTGEPIVQLIITKNATHSNEQKLTKPEGQYVTLSHCWGSGGKPFCLKKTNFNIFRNNGIPLKELPRTFADAIDFARRLSPTVRYIWIDSICIIQGDREDWLHESTQMCQVYRKSYCNISATAAPNGSHGLYTERDPRHLWSEDVRLNTQYLLGAETDAKRQMWPGGPEVPILQRCGVVDPSHWDRKVDAAPVNTRAWVLQERLLAPRVLHFCDDQVAWECRELCASESSVDGVESLELKHGVIRNRVQFKDLVAFEYGPPSLSNSEIDVAYKAHENWKQIIERYSLTNLTNDMDKLIALAGIAEQVSTKIKAPYIAGMWQTRYFSSQLLWRVEPLWDNKRFLHPSRRPKRYRAPSFSWAAIDAPQGIRCGETENDSNLLIKITEVHVQPEPLPNSEFGLVKEGSFIKLQCHKLLPIVIQNKKKRDGQLCDDIYSWFLVGDKEEESAQIYPNVYLDSPQDDFRDIEGRHGSIWLVPAHTNKSGDLICLLLQRKVESDQYLGTDGRADDGRGECYRRVGLTVVPRYVSKMNIFKDETPENTNEEFQNAGKTVIDIV